MTAGVTGACMFWSASPNLGKKLKYRNVTQTSRNLHYLRSESEKKKQRMEP
jgi:hypothetical protein